jgi:hypothetical protein
VGHQQVIAEMSPENRRMLELVKHGGFDLDYPVSTDVVLGRKDIDASRPA